MIVFAMLLLAQAGNPLGQVLYERNCSVPYCHGTDSAPGRAPALTGKGWVREEVERVVRDGKPGGMPGFRTVLNGPELQAVVNYVMKLGGTPPSGGVRPAISGGPARQKHPPEMESAREFFFDATRMGGCGRCHELDGWGTPIGPDLLKHTPGGRSGLVTAAPKGEAAFFGIPGPSEGNVIRVYDLSARLPVLRSFGAGQVVIEQGAKWSHADAVKGYSKTEMDRIAVFIAWLKKR